MAKEIKQKRLIFDIILVLTLLVIATLAFFAWQTLGGGAEATDGAMVVVRQENKIIAELPLNVDTERTIGEGGTNRIKIEDGRVRMISSTCPGYQDCVELGEIGMVGEKIVCLPNRISVSIEK